MIHGSGPDHDLLDALVLIDLNGDPVCVDTPVIEFSHDLVALSVCVGVLEISRISGYGREQRFSDELVRYELNVRHSLHLLKKIEHEDSAGRRVGIDHGKVRDAVLRTILILYDRCSVMINAKRGLRGFELIAVRFEPVITAAVHRDGHVEILIGDDPGIIREVGFPLLIRDHEAQVMRYLLLIKGISLLSHGSERLCYCRARTDRIPVDTDVRIQENVFCANKLFCYVMQRIHQISSSSSTSLGSTA